MKNLTIKKVALGLFLAGYAASSAFAAPLTADTAATIKGTAPVMKSQDGAGNDHTVSTFAKDASGNVITSGSLRVGDSVHIKYRLADPDGDVDPTTNSVVLPTLKIFVKQTVGGSWNDITSALTSSNSISIVHDNSDPELAEIKIKVTSDFVGHSFIGFQIQEKTQYGAPNENLMLFVNNMFGSGSPNTVDPNAPGVTVPTNPGPGITNGPGDNNGGNVPTGPILPSGGQLKLGIYQIDSTGAFTTPMTNYVVSGTPKQGERYAAVVWDDGASGDDIYDPSNETDYTNSYTYTWTATGSAHGVGATTRAFTATEGVADRTPASGKGEMIWLGSANNASKHNSIYSANYSSYLAGLQGFTLHVEAN